MTTHIIFSTLAALALAGDIITSHIGLGYGMREVGAFGKWTIPVGVGGWALLTGGGALLEGNPAAVCTLLLIPFAVAHGVAARKNQTMIRHSRERGVRRVG